MLLQIARTCIYDPEAPHQSVEIHLLVDSGSQRLYLSERAMKLLNLAITGEQKLSIPKFGYLKVYSIVNVNPSELIICSTHHM